MEQAETALSSEEQKAQFRKAAITHRLLEQTDRAMMRAIREPAGFASVVVYGPTGVSKTKMIEVLPTGSTVPSRLPGEASSASIDTGNPVPPTKPKRTRRVGEPKPNRYVVGEKERERGT